MRKTFTFWCLLLLGATTAYSQNGYRPAYPLEVGIQLGTTHFLGDLGGIGGWANDNKFIRGANGSPWQDGVGQPFVLDTDIESVRPIIGAYARYSLGAHFVARLDMSYLQLASSDKDAGISGFTPTTIGETAAWFRYYRNLSFRSHVFESTISGEIIPYNFELGSGYSDNSVLSPYLHIGVGVFAFNPQALYKGSWIDLQPLSTEGQGLVDGRATYDLVQLNVPMGFGVKWTYNDTWAISLEAGYRLTFTDYIDDVSKDYVDPSVFTQNMDGKTAALAAALARRSSEIDSGNVLDYVTKPGEQRGNPEKNDAYYTISLRFGYYLDPTSMGGGGGRQGCPVW